MAADNSFHIVGRLGADANLQHLENENGTALCRVSVAQETWNGKENVTQWHNITIWGKTAESLEQYLTKGKMIAVTGEITYRTVESEDGENTIKHTNLNAQNVRLLGGGKDSPSEETFED